MTGHFVFTPTDKRDSTQIVCSHVFTVPDFGRGLTCLIHLVLPFRLYRFV